MMFELDPVFDAWCHAIFDTVRQINLAIKSRPDRRKPTTELKHPRQRRPIKEKELLYNLPDPDRDEFLYNDAVIVSRPKEYPHDIEEFEEPQMHQQYDGAAYNTVEWRCGRRIKFPPAL